jgi:hypothetical protein
MANLPLTLKDLARVGDDLGRAAILRDIARFQAAIQAFQTEQVKGEE